jgi:hypothetical protein
MTEKTIPRRTVTLQYKNLPNFVKNVVSVDTGNNTVSVSGDERGTVSSGDQIEIKGSTNNDDTYSVSDVSFDTTSVETIITVSGGITDSTADGTVFANVGSPQVADGKEITLFAESVKENFQKKPQFQTINKGEENHFTGDRTLVVDTMDAKHTFELSAFVYSNRQGRHSLSTNILPDGDVKSDFASTSKQNIQAEEFNKFIPLGDTGIKHDSESVSTHEGTSLTRGTDYEMNYDRGEIKFLDSDNISSTVQTVNFGPINLGSTTVISDGFRIDYKFDTSAQNIASLVRRMSQLGNPFVMRLDSKTATAANGESSRDYLVTAKKTNIVSKASKPEDFKLEMELRKGSTER